MDAAFAQIRKKCREDVSIEYLTKNSNKTQFLRRFITMNKTWVQHFTAETKVQSKSIDLKERTGSKEEKDRSIYRQGHGVGFFGMRVG
ncbi:unnamed protein product [Euphydryas editha]|uniref:Uncharacterized protein n=1 Tax=Euphydryas editha TaxID=104508 RepID=A0AAU9UI80_EUPED|nr:unnamed protein product [Euphydryas editha]